MTPEVNLGANGSAESVVAPATEASPASQGTSSASQGQPAGTASAVDVQGATQSTTTDDDPLAGIPTLEEFNQLEDGIQHKKSLIQMRQAIDNTFKPQLAEIQQKFSVFEPIADRFEKSEQLQEALGWHDKLFGAYERDERNQLVPATQTFAQEVAQRDPLVADYLSADLLNMETKDLETGQMVPRINIALKAMAADPQRRADALKILGGVEPTSIAPTWQPTAEELNVIDDPANPTTEGKALQDIYRSLPYDERESLKLNDPAFIKNYLKKEQFQQNLMRENQIATDRGKAEDARREQYMAHKAQEAGDQYVETQFKQGFTEFANSIVEKTNFIQPLDPQSPEAQQMPPDQVAQFNQQAQQINTGVGKMVATVTAALSHPDTRWFATDFLLSLGVDQQTIDAFDNARTEFARNARDFGELNFAHTAGQNGNGQAPHQGLGTLQSNANRAMKELKGRGNLVAQPLLKMLSTFFEMKAGSYNQTLNGGAVARPAANGTHFDPTAVPAQRPQGWLTRQEIERQFS